MTRATLVTLKVPTKRNEAYRYSDIDALARVWPVAKETITVAANQNWSHSIINTVPDDDVFVRHLVITCEAGSRGHLQILNAGGRLGRIVVDVTCHASSDFTLDAVQLGCGHQTVELVTTVTHAEPGATSRQQVRSILSDHATGSYLGKVAVARGSNGTDSAQDVKAMLLTRSATANAKPELEIYADDVKCAHGATVGELDKDALFYLAARGIAPPEAKKLLLQAFIASVFEGVEGEGALTAAALAKLGAMV
ncbi:MAG: SufD family Fe-S cluster assembly protein [Sphingopyxis sp.]